MLLVDSKRENSIVWLIAFLQFVNILDFMMVMPLGPDFARALGISASRIGDIGGSYTASAAISGLAGFFFLDRFDRKKALLVCVAGLAIGTWAAAFSWNLESLIAARILAGAFGGPATAISLSVIADLVPIGRRGKAMGTVMATFAVASVIGVPLGLEIAQRFNWQAPFVGVGALAAIAGGLLLRYLPSLTAHITAAEMTGAVKTAGLFAQLRRPEVFLSCLMASLIMFSMFSIIPNIAPFVLSNLHFPREKFSSLYLIGGVVSFIGMKLAGRLVDKLGTVPIGCISSVLLILTIYVSIVHDPSYGPMVLFVGFMAASSFRTVAYNTLVSQVPKAPERAGFMSILSATQHFSSAAAAILSARFLTVENGLIVGMPAIGKSAIILSTFVPLLFFAINSIVRKNFVANTLAKVEKVQ